MIKVNLEHKYNSYIHVSHFVEVLLYLLLNLYFVMLYKGNLTNFVIRITLKHSVTAQNFKTRSGCRFHIQPQSLVIQILSERQSQPHVCFEQFQVSIIIVI